MVSTHLGHPLQNTESTRISICATGAFIVTLTLLLSCKLNGEFKVPSPQRILRQRVKS